MIDSTSVRNWLFKGPAVEQALNEFEANGLAVKATDDPGALQRVVSLEDFPSEIRRMAMRALPAYIAFFCLENSVRDLVAERLAEVHGTSWWTACASKGIQEKAAKRADKEGQDRWHARRGEHSVHYTDFGDLKSLIINNFVDFEDLFPDQNWISSRLAELELSRNIIAHSNVLEERELERIKLYMQDWTRQVG